MMAIHCPTCDEPHAVGEVCARCTTPRLWVVTVSFEFVVLASDRDHAHEVAAEHVSDDLDNTVFRDVVEHVCPLRSLGDLPPQWDGDCIPWGSEDDKTCAEVLAEGEG